SRRMSIATGTGVLAGGGTGPSRVVRSPVLRLRRRTLHLSQFDSSLSACSSSGGSGGSAVCAATVARLLTEWGFFFFLVFFPSARPSTAHVTSAPAGAEASDVLAAGTGAGGQTGGCETMEGQRSTGAAAA